jgi:hypothetical protein
MMFYILSLIRAVFVEIEKDCARVGRPQAMVWNRLREIDHSTVKTQVKFG